MLSKNISQLSLDLLKKVELEVFNLKNDFVLLQWFISPFKYFLFGLNELSKPMFKWSVICFLFLLIWFYSIVSFFADLEQEVANFAINFTFFVFVVFIPIAITYFDLPSTFVNSGISEEKTKFVLQFLKDNSFPKKDEMEVLQKQLENFKDKVKKRINLGKWIIGILVGIVAYLFKLGVDLGYKGIFDLSLPKQAGYFLFFTFIYYLFLASYEKASIILFETIELGCDRYYQEILKDDVQKLTEMAEIQNNLNREKQIESFFQPMKEKKYLFPTFNLGVKEEYLKREKIYESDQDIY